MTLLCKDAKSPPPFRPDDNAIGLSALLLTLLLPRHETPTVKTFNLLDFASRRALRFWKRLSVVQSHPLSSFLHAMTNEDC